MSYTYVLTRSLSEFRINPDQSIDRMAAMQMEFHPWVAAGAKWDTIRIGAPITGAVRGHPFFTSTVLAVVHR